MNRRFPDPRWSPPPLTGFRPPFVREDEWLSYAFGYDPRASDKWIVRRNSSDMKNQPLWIGSDCRSLFVSGEDRQRLVRLFAHDRRFAEFRLAWQDPLNPRLVHHIGSFQIDRLFNRSRADEEKPAEGLRLERKGNSIILTLDYYHSLEIGKANEPGPGEKTERISSLLADKVLGKSKDELLVRYIREDENIIRLNRRRRYPAPGVPKVIPRRTPKRDYELSYVWDNYFADPLLYTKLRGRLGLFTLLE